VVLALSRDKDPAAMLEHVQALAPARLVATRTRNPRALPAETLAMHAARAGWDPLVEPEVAGALRRALAEAGAGRVLLAGSLFAVGEAMEAYGGAPGAMA
jgi:folylpolyglutamate synthase/dihydropteroate synthase